MKTLLSILLILFAFNMFAQTQPEQILVNKSDLPKEVIDNIEQKQKVQQYGEWVGLGKEIGIAINEGLGAVVEQANNFGTTRVGTFTMFMIAWSVFGKDIVRIIIAFPLVFIGMFFIIRYYRKTFLPQKRIKTSSGFWIFGKREYTYEKAEYQGDYLAPAGFFTVVVVAAWVGMCMIIAFA